MCSLVKFIFKGLQAIGMSFMMLKTYWTLIKFAIFLCGAITIYSYLKTLWETLTWNLYTRWHATPEGAAAANFTEFVIFEQVPSLFLESLSPSIWIDHIMAPLSVLNQFLERAANFTGLVILKQVPSLSLNSIVDWLFTRSFVLHLSIILNALCIILFILLWFRTWKCQREPTPKPENTEWQGVWRDLGEFLERWTSSVSWDFTPEHLENLENLSGFLRQGCHDSGRSEEAQMIRGLANAYRALFNTILERERIFENERKILLAEKEYLQEVVLNEQKNLQNERDSLQSKLDDLQLHHDTLQSERDMLQSKRDVLQNEKDSLQSKLDTLQSERGILQKERDSLQSKLDNLQLQHDTLQYERDMLQSERGILQNERDSLQSKLDDLQLQRNTLQSERDTLRSERDILKSERDVLKTERDALQHAKVSLQGEITKFQSHQTKLKSELSALTVERDKLRVELESKSIRTDQPDQPQEASASMSVATLKGRKTKRVSTQLKQKKEEESEVEGAGDVREEEEGESEEPLKVLSKLPFLSAGEGPSVRPRSPTPRRARSPEGVAGEQDIVTITERSLKLNEIRGLRKDFTRHPSEPIVTWLLRCWDNGASSVSLDGSEARQLGGIARDSAIDRHIGTCQNGSYTLWKRMLLAVKAKYPFKEDLMPEKRKWTDIEKGIRYLRECAVVETLYSPTFIHDDPDQEHDPERVRCTPNMWRTFTKTAPERHASTFAAMYGRGERRPLLSELINRLQDYELHLTPLRACVSAIRKVVEKLDRMESKQEDIIDELSTMRDADGSMADEDQNSQDPLLEELTNLVSSRPASSSVSAIKRRRPPARANDNSKTRRLALWRFLRDHGEDMRKWHKQPTSALEARVKELQDRSTSKVKSSKRAIAPVAADNQGNK